MNAIEEEAIKEQSVGYLKFSGEAVPDGIIGANAAGRALLGFDECLRYFNRKQSSGFARLEYDNPIKTTEGSWVIWVLGPVGTAAAIFAGAYAKKAAEKMAENDFKDIGMKDVLKKSVDALKNVVDLIKHLKGKIDWSQPSVQWRAENGVIGVQNEDGEIFYLPIDYFRWYLDMPPKLLLKLTSVIEMERSMTIAVKEGGRFVTTTVTENEKLYFGHEDAANEDDFLFPELEHGMSVVLDGHLTRGNENANSIGLLYNGHVLNCVPYTGNIRRYKYALFLHCQVRGTISRLHNHPTILERRPTIIVDEITPLETDDQYNLFAS